MGIIVFGLIAVLLLNVGCQSRQSPPPEIGGRSSRMVKAPITSFPGFLTDAHTFRLCRSGQRFLVRDPTETLAASLAQLRADGDPGQEVFAVLDGRLGKVRSGDARGGDDVRGDDDTRGGDGVRGGDDARGGGDTRGDGTAIPYAAVLNVSFVEYLRIEGVGCEYDWGAFDFRLFGNEPFWMMDITSNVAILNRLGQDVQHWVGLESSAEKGAHFFSSPDGTMEAVVIPEQCVDSMSGAIYGYSAVVTAPEGEFRGCGFASR